MSTVSLLRVRDWHLSTQSIMGFNISRAEPDLVYVWGIRVRHGPRHSWPAETRESKTVNKTTRKMIQTSLSFTRGCTKCFCLGDKFKSGTRKKKEIETSGF